MAADSANYTMLDEVAHRLGQNIQTVLGLDYIGTLTAAATMMISNRDSNRRRDIEIGYHGTLHFPALPSGRRSGK